jgi:LmbE family N-acetylglucosaminyl deacetylase
MRNIFLLFLVLLADPALCAEHIVGSAQNTNTVAFYFGAHPDDWQLFMNPNAYYDVQKPSNKVVFVYVTAGDAGLGLGTGGRSLPYYLARENGAKLSVKFMADAAKAPEIPVDSVASVSGHAIKRWLYGNTVSYFMRLPDGSPQGTGYVATAEQSLKRLHERTIPAMTAIDDSTTYQSWSDLRTTLRKLIDHERGTATNVWVNIPDTNIEKNVGDHADHQHMAQGVLEAIADLPWINKALYLDYVTADMKENMNSAEREIEAGTFAALSMGLTALDHPSPWDRLHRSWLSRHYFRIEPGLRTSSP